MLTFQNQVNKAIQVQCAILSTKFLFENVPKAVNSAWVGQNVGHKQRLPYNTQKFSEPVANQSDIGIAIAEPLHTGANIQNDVAALGIPSLMKFGFV